MNGEPSLTVLMAAPTPPPRNGMSVTTQALQRGLHGRDVRLVLVDTADRRGLANVGKLDVANVMSALWSGARFACRLLVLRPDVVYVPVAQNALGFLRDCLFLVPAHLARRPVVIHLHGSAFAAFYESSGTPLRWLIRRVVGHTTFAVVLGPRAAHAFAGLLDSRKVRVVPNGLPDLNACESRQTLSGRQAATPHQRQRLALFIGSLVPGKGILDVLRALEFLQDAPDVRFVFAGEFRDPRVRAEAHRLVRAAHMESRVTFVGDASESEVASLAQSARMLLLPATQPEGQPLVILEALRAGTPVIVTPSGCIPDTVTDGREGLFVPPGDPRALASAIARLCNDDLLWEGMSAAARQRYEQDFTLGRWVADMKSVFVEAAAQDPSAI